MKRRLPKTDQGGFVVVLNSVPPLTTDAKDHRGGHAGPCRAFAAVHANPIAVTAAPARVSDHRHGSPPPNSTHNDPNPPANIAAREKNLRTQPLAVVCGTPTASAAGRTPDRPAVTASITSPIASTPSKRPTNTKPGINACDTAHRPHFPRRIQTR